MMADREHSHEVHAAAVAAQSARIAMLSASADQKNRVLTAMAKLLEENVREILLANRQDMTRARNHSASLATLRRLELTPNNINSRIRAVQELKSLPDPVGNVFYSGEPEAGLTVEKVSVPIGVILVIFEARPHVSVNGPAVGLKAGNCTILRGGSEAANTNGCLVTLWRKALDLGGLPSDAVQLLGGDHKTVEEALHLSEMIQLVIPRGGRALMDTVAVHAKMPVLHHEAGNCHQYVDANANLDKAMRVLLDSKLTMPAVCNAMESLLVHRDLLPWCAELVNELASHGVEVRGCGVLKALVPNVVLANDDDWKTEYLREIVSIKVVGSVCEAIEHINTYGSHHTDGIITEDQATRQAFIDRVESAVVLCNASTMYCDGSLLGFGPEIGISTSRLHARGPVGTKDLTTYKIVVRGNGHTMCSEVTT